MKDRSLGIIEGGQPNETLYSYSTAWGLPEYIKTFSEIWPHNDFINNSGEFWTFAKPCKWKLIRKVISESFPKM